MRERSLLCPGLSNDDWYVLKNALLNVGYGMRPESAKKGVWDALPEHLRVHPVAKEIREFERTGKKSHLDRAAAILTNNDPQAFLYIMKA